VAVTKVEAAKAIIEAVSDSIEELGSVPSGHLYASLMGVLTLDEYQLVLNILRARGDVELTGGHEVRWVRPRR